MSVPLGDLAPTVRSSGLPSKAICLSSHLPRHALTPKSVTECKLGFTAANSICQQNCAVDSDCTTGPTSLNSHLACVNGSCSWSETLSFVFTSLDHH